MLLIFHYTNYYKTYHHAEIKFFLFRIEFQPIRQYIYPQQKVYQGTYNVEINFRLRHLFLTMQWMARTQSDYLRFFSPAL